jgi:CheY-like chemotaxis protein
VQSVPGQGSCFTLQLPLPAGSAGGWIDDPVRWQRVGRLDAPQAVQVPSLQGHVLLAEDGEHNQRLIAALVEGTGATLEIVDNGEAAVQHALAGDHDLVLMDIQMPVMDGVTAVQLLRGAGHGGPIVALTANVMRHDIETYRQIGCNDVLAKPIDRARLYGVLSLHLHARGGEAPTSAREDQLAAVVERLARSFREELPGTIGQLQQAMGAQQWSELRHLAHRIKGLAGSIGFPELTALAEPVEIAVQAGAFDDAAGHCQRLVAALHHTFASREAEP